MSEQKLDCYIVGDHDYYAAYSARQAEKLHMDLNDFEEDDREEACLVVGAFLDKEWVEEDTRETVGTLRQWLSQAKEPCWLSGTQ